MYFLLMGALTMHLHNPQVNNYINIHTYIHTYIKCLNMGPSVTGSQTSERQKYVEYSARILAIVFR